MELISINRDWPIRIAKHKVLYRKAFLLNELDKIILSFLNMYNDTIGFNELGCILGFALENKNDEQLYFDIAEADIFSSLLETLSNYHLIIIDKNEHGLLIISTTQWGIEARSTGMKHLFYEGVIGLNEHHLLVYFESLDSLFDFSKYGHFSELSNIKEVKPYSVSSQDQQKNIFLHKSLLNFNTNKEENSTIEILWVNDAIITFDKIISKVSLSLLRIGEDYKIQTSLSGIPSPELDAIICQNSNSILYSDWLLLLRYQVYLRDIEPIRASEIAQYVNHINWQTILSDPRISWDSEWFQFLSSEDVSNYTIWNQVIQHCPYEVLLSNIDAYAEYWDWGLLSNKVETNYIITTINQFPWDIDVFQERIDQYELERLLMTMKDVNAINDWKEITKKVSLEFIVRSIKSLPFDLRSIVFLEEAQSGPIILNNLQLNWDWSLISSTYSISYLIINVELLSNYLDIVALIIRILKNEAEFTLSFYDPKFSQYLIGKASRANFKIGKEQNVILNTETFQFLSDNELLFWGNENIPGVEANQSVKWSTELFTNYSNLVKNQEGYDSISQTIESIDLIENNEEFPWNFRILSIRKDLKWSFEFIQKYQDKLSLKVLINNIPSIIVADNLPYFIQWATEKELMDLISKLISSEFSFERILLNRLLLNSNNIQINWGLVFNDKNVVDLSQIAVLNEAELLELPSFNNLRNFLSSKCEVYFILDNPDLFWDWNLVTKDRIDTKLLLDDAFQFDYASYIYWPHLIDNFILATDLSPTNKLSTLAVLISKSPPNVIKESWSAITKKILPKDLWIYIQETIQFDIFNWDWDYISSSKVIPIDHRFLSTYSDKINWKLLSRNGSLSSFFQFSKVVYKDIRQWLERTLEYLYAYKNEWDFASLSTLNNLTWNEGIISEFEDKWDWHLLSATSPLLTNSNKNNTISEYNTRRLIRFSRLVDWSALSSRFEVTLYPEIVGRFINRAWNWEKLSLHPRFELTKEFLLEHSAKPWDYHALTVHHFLKIDKELLIQLEAKDWDFGWIYR